MIGPQQGIPDAAERMAERLAQITRDAHRTNLARVDRLDVLLTGDVDQGERDEAGEIAHKLAGSAGTFGYTRVSDRARDLELYLVQDEFTDAPDDPPDVQRHRLRSIVDELRELLSSEPDEID